MAGAALIAAALAIWLLVLPAARAIWAHSGKAPIEDAMRLLAGALIVLAALVPIGFAIFALYDRFTMWRYARSPGLQARLAERWRQASATVVSVEKTPEGHSVRFRYLDDSGEMREGVDVLADDEYKGWKAGQSITVFFDRETPGRAAIDV